MFKLKLERKNKERESNTMHTWLYVALPTQLFKSRRKHLRTSKEEKRWSQLSYQYMSEESIVLYQR